MRGNEKEDNIKIFVSCHKESHVPKHALLNPIQVGTELSSCVMEGYYHDNSGKNISAKNRSYCELTGQFWVWNNIQAEHYGFFHYRRYLYPDLSEKRPYRLEETPSLELLNRLNYDGFSELISQYDMILPIGEEMCLSVRDYYKNARFHHYEHLLILETIIKELTPQYEHAMTEYLSGTIHYFGNIFVMRKEWFVDYSKWLFAILDEFDKRVDLTGYSEQERRVDGYLGERILGIYYTFWKKQIKTIELPGVHFGLQRGGKKIVYRLLPPSTKRRAAIRKLYYRLRKK